MFVYLFFLERVIENNNFIFVRYFVGNLEKNFRIFLGLVIDNCKMRMNFEFLYVNVNDYEWKFVLMGSVEEGLDKILVDNKNNYFEDLVLVMKYNNFIYERNIFYIRWYLYN